MPGDAGESAYVGDVCRRVVVVLGRRPSVDNGTDGVEAVLVVVRAGEQVEGGSPPPFKCFKLAERAVALRFR